MKADEATAVFESHRGMLRGLAYRMLGSLSEAEDMVHETYLRWTLADRSEIRNPRAWLVTTCSRLAVDELRSARVRRESYVGPWLPEPWVETANPPDALMERDESVSYALLVVLEQVTPAERAAFLLHDVFDTNFEEVAEILGKTPAACRKLVSRARQRIGAEAPKWEVSEDEYRQLTEAFFKASRDGDRETLVALLHPEVSLHSDGGGKAQAAQKIIEGGKMVSGFLTSVLGRYRGDESGVTVLPTRFNDGPGLLVYEGQQLVTAFTVEVYDGQIGRVFAIRNPDKLAYFESGRLIGCNGSTPHPAQ